MTIVSLSTLNLSPSDETMAEVQLLIDEAVKSPEAITAYDLAKAVVELTHDRILGNYQGTPGSDEIICDELCDYAKHLHEYDVSACAYALKQKLLEACASAWQISCSR